ncbi:MAG TPA: FG-GAP-like repeat-containing protein [Thermoanaerobaculia bacterium]
MKPHFLQLSIRLAASVLVLFTTVKVQAYYPYWERTGYLAVQPTRMVVGDFDGDGRPDIAGVFSDYFLRLSRTTAEGTIGPFIEVFATSSLVGLVVSDVDGDNKPDLIGIESATNRVFVLRSNGDGTFASAKFTALDFVPAELVAAHFNADGRVDLAIRSADSSLVVILLGDGTGGFAESSRFSIAASSYRIAVGDVDGDGKTDLLVAQQSPEVRRVHFGTGDGALGAVVEISAAARSTQIVLSDLDADGDLDVISTEATTGTVTVVLNTGSRTFAYPHLYSIPSGWASHDLAIFDATGDGKRDVIVPLTSGVDGAIATFRGHGTGLFADPALYKVVHPLKLQVGDFNLDGRPDMAVRESGGISIARNRSGDSRVGARLVTPVISVGQSATIEASAGRAVFGDIQAPPVTGELVLSHGGLPIATMPIEGETSSLTIEGLSQGEHEFIVTYEGDLNHRPSVSTPLIQRVLITTTTTTLTRENGEGSIVFGQSLFLQGSVTSPLPDPITGTLRLHGTGEFAETRQAPQSAWMMPLPAGTYDLTVGYSGDASHPPSLSTVFSQVVLRAESSVTCSPGAVRYGQTGLCSASVNPRYSAAYPSGAVKVYSGSTLVASGILSSGADSDISLPVMPAGTHHLRLVYEGDDNYNRSESTFAFKVIPPDVFHLEVSASGNSIVARGYPLVTTNRRFDIWMKVNTGGWSRIAQGWASPYATWQASPDSVFAFRMEEFDVEGNHLSTSNVDFAMLGSFSDDPVMSGSTIKAAHIAEILTKLNVMSAAIGLAPIALPDAGKGQPVRASHVAALGNALNDLRIYFGAPTLVLDGAVSGGVIRSRHIQDLRDAVH